MRLFVAIELSDEVRAALVEVRRSLGGWSKSIRWTPAEQLHLTMKFLGEVEESAVADVTAAMTSAAGSVGAFDLTLDRSGCFPPKGPVRIVWVGALEPSDALVELVDALEGAMEEIGFARESRAFSPHLTIGRVREDSSDGGLRRAVDAVSVRKVGQRVSSLTLMASKLSPQGASYSVVHREALDASGT